MASAEGEAFLQDGAGAGARSGERRAGGREAGWQERYFSAWRGLFMYKQSRDFAVCLEISFRGAVWLVLFGSPIIWGLNKDLESPFYESTFWGKILEKNGIVSFVYTLAPTVGQTISNAVGGVAGTLTAAAFSLLMYLVYPDGCSGAERFELCYFFGWLAGAASIVCCQLLDVGMSFRIFYISNFVYFWMAFLNPDAKLRTAPDSPTEWFMGLEFVDWGGEAYDGVVAMISGACLALIVTLLPYPMNSMERARDSAFAAVSMLEQTWAKLADFYLANDKDERRQAMMICSMKAFKNHVCSLKESTWKPPGGSRGSLGSAGGRGGHSTSS
ncbi:unnamed protein product [Prorocentrum cordatum]|uniref:Derlin n=1 Tax=Prorocentrum cordatum TaxID=2364126 RepID=A0ABN9TEF3_9DINO|nr:unnamed protein product [Polarella glacialis]